MSDSESSHSSDSEESQAQGTARNKKAVAASSGDDDSGSDDDSENDDDVDQEQSDYDESDKKARRGGGKRPASKGKAKSTSKRAKVSLFEDEAEVDDDDEEEEEEEDRFKNLNEEELSENEKLITQRLERRRKAGSKFLDANEADVVRELEARYADQNRTVRQVGDDEGPLQSRNSQLPTVNDPKLFCVKVKPGEERMLCIQLMNKYRAMKAQGKQPAIFSVLHASSKGFIYVESRTQQSVSDMLYGIHGVFRSKTTLVPLNQMPMTLRVVTQKAAIREGEFVRLRRFPYRGDLAKVVGMDDQIGKITVQFVPRMDFALFSLDPEQRKEHLGKKLVPPKRFFNADEVEAAGGRADRRRPPWWPEQTLDCVEEDYFLNGYMLKPFNERMLQTKGVKPTLDELQAFRHGGRAIGSDEEDDQDGALDDGAVLEQLNDKPRGASLRIGDKVIVKEGELQNMKATVVAVEVTGNVKVEPLDESVRGHILDFMSHDLIKVFNTGEHVKILNGAYAGETGTIVKIIEHSEKWRAIIFTDSSAKEVVAFLDDLQVTAEIAQTRQSLKGLDMLDLVSLGTQVGIIVKVGTESVDVLLQTGNTRTVTVQEVRAKLNNKSKDTSAMDKARNTISENSMVKIVAGENAGLEGTIKRLYRSFLFVHSRMYVPNAGIFVERARNVQQAGIKLRNTAGFGQANSSSKALAGTATMSAGRGRGRGAPSDDAIIGKSVRIRSGRHKGYVGVAVSATEDVVKVEFHAKKMMSEFPRDKVVVVGDRNGQNPFGQPQQNNTFTSQAHVPGYQHPSTLMYAPPTPTHAPGTPSAADNGASEAWNPSYGAATPAGAPGTPGADDTWGGSKNAYKPPPTPAFSSGPSGYGGATPAPVVPQTPATPAVPATPAAFGDSDATFKGDWQKGDSVRILTGVHAGQIGVLQGIDDKDAIVMVKGQIAIIEADTLTRV